MCCCNAQPTLQNFAATTLRVVAVSDCSVVGVYHTLSYTCLWLLSLLTHACVCVRVRGGSVAATPQATLQNFAATTLPCCCSE